MCLELFIDIVILMCLIVVYYQILGRYTVTSVFERNAQVSLSGRICKVILKKQ
jgi:hypothetical protein